MKHRVKTRIVTAWVLLLTLMPLYIVKAVHFHNDGSSISMHDSGHHHQASDDGCLICHFLLSPFTEAADFHFTFVDSSHFHDFVAVFADVVVLAHRAYGLRAPPVC